jgi:hypothetical protein
LDALTFRNSRRRVWRSPGNNVPSRAVLFVYGSEILVQMLCGDENTKSTRGISPRRSVRNSADARGESALKLWTKKDEEHFTAA